MKINEKYAALVKSLVQEPAAGAQAPWAASLQKYRAKSRHESMAFFYDVLAAPLGAGRGPYVGTFCNIVPDEIVLACGATPVRLCNADGGCAKAGELLLPGDVCPALKASAGGILGTWLPALDSIVVPAACDGKAKLGELLAPFKDVYFLDVPRDSDYLESADIWESRFKLFHEFMRARLRRKADRCALLEACRRTNARTAAFREIFEARGRTSGLLSAIDYFVMAHASFFVTPELFAGQAKKLRDEMLKAQAEPHGGRRILLAGSPVLFPHFKILHLLDEAGCDVAADTLCTAYGRMYDPVQLDEETQAGIVRAVALKHLAASMCPCFLGIGKLLDRIVELVRAFRLDGVIYHTLRLCQVFEMQGAVLRQVLKEEGIPLLSLQTDLGTEDTGQLKTRIEAFLEMIE